MIAEAIRDLGFAGAREPLSGAPLSGGVSCDIWRIDLPSGPVCAKRALPKLRVAEDWFAPTNRIDLEAAYFRFVGGLQPGAVPGVLGYHPALGVLVTRYLPPATHTVWKEELKNGVVRTDLIMKLAALLRRVHDRSHGNAPLKAQFYKPDLIFSLRLSPYFLATANVHSDMEVELSGLVRQFQDNCHWLVHGDFSPKNILFGPDAPVVLDAECANFGDAAFDVAFCITHLFLKAVWMPQYTSAYQEAFDVFAASYFANHRDAELEARAARYLAGLMLARIDGKSPVEYISDTADKDAVRAFARAHLATPASRLGDMADRWFRQWADRSERGAAS
ncbi:MAG TPA: phosphotransferase [Hyphomonas sp.]|nr:phosphotransferase [Hyphomonas sp.]